MKIQALVFLHCSTKTQEISFMFHFQRCKSVIPSSVFLEVCAVILVLAGATAFLRAHGNNTSHNNPLNHAPLTQSPPTEQSSNKATKQPNAYTTEITEWRKARENKLRSDNGWLTVAGLYWLKQGENWLGTIPTSNVLLPKKAPATLGSLRLDGDTLNPRLHFFPVTNIPVNITKADGTPVNPILDSAQTLAFDNDNGSKPDIISIGDLSMFVVRRTTKSGLRFGIRLRDKASAARQHFKGCTWFPVKPEYRTEARFTPYAEPKTIEIENILGGLEKHTAIGTLDFTLNGKEYKLEAEQEGNKLFINFRDETSGKAGVNETYPAGRFLYAELPQNGVTVLDFNKAENPPCAFTNFATCPLPPRINWLKTKIEAGEKTHHPYEENNRH